MYVLKDFSKSEVNERSCSFKLWLRQMGFKDPESNVPYSNMDGLRDFLGSYLKVFEHYSRGEFRDILLGKSWCEDQTGVLFDNQSRGLG